MLNEEDLWKVLIDFPAGFMEPIFIGDPPMLQRIPACATGTGTLAHLNGRYLIITCHHVLKAYRDLQGQPRHFQVGGLPLDPDVQLVDLSQQLDLAVLEVQPHQLVDTSLELGLQRAKFFGPATWPPKPVEKTDAVSFAGFPAVWREQTGLNRFEMFMFSHGAAGVYSARETHFATRLELDKVVTLSSAKQVTDMGGMSGGPVFRWRSKSPEPQLVGIVYEYQSSFDLLFARSTRVILQDGKIDHSAL
jgi:hypothetical protein